MGCSTSNVERVAAGASMVYRTLYRTTPNYPKSNCTNQWATIFIKTIKLHMPSLRSADGPVDSSMWKSV